MTKESNPLMAPWAGAGLVDRSDAGRLRIGGADALDLLNRLTTNNLEELPAGHGRLTVLTNANGRVIDLLALGALGDGMLCLTSPGRAEAVVDWLDTYTFSEEITVANRSSETIQLTLSGPHAVTVLAAAGFEAPPAAPDRLALGAIGGEQAVVWRALVGGADGFDIIAETGAGDGVRAALLAAGTTPVSPETWNAFRIANGMPIYGAEFGDFNNPLESRLRGAINEEKGCYTGQEIIARLLTYGKVQRRLMSAALTGPVEAGAALLAADGARAGTLTSVASTPDGRRVALALVAMKLAGSGSTFDVEGAPGVQATIAEPAYALATEPLD